MLNYIYNYPTLVPFIKMDSNILTNKLHAPLQKGNVTKQTKKQREFFLGSQNPKQRTLKLFTLHHKAGALI